MRAPAITWSRTLWIAAIVLALAWVLLDGAWAATSSTVVSATVPSATFLSIDPLDTPVAGDCRPGSAGITEFGSVLPGSPAVTSADCAVRFGSSNNSASLRLFHADATGDAMRRSSVGASGEVEHDHGAIAGSLLGALRQTDGKIVATGRSGATAVVLRYLADGTPDPSFGIGGRVLADIDAGTDVGYGVAQQSDGKLVIAGSMVDPVNADMEMFVLRLLTDGTPDPAFGTGGVVKVAHTPENDLAQDVEVQADGKILVGGYATYTGDLQLAVLRLSTTGVPDGSWGVGGMAIDGSGSVSESVIGMTLQPDGKLVTVGRAWLTPSWGAIVTRYTTTGILDGSFATGGRYTQNLGPGQNYLDDVVIQPDGKVLAAGTSVEAGADRDFVALRLSALGVPDGSFGTGGLTTVDVDGRFSFVGEGGLGLLPDGRVLIAGAVNTDAGHSLAAALLSPSGVHDTTWGVGGVVATRVGSFDNRLAALLVEPDGSFTLVGSAGTRTALSRVHVDVAPRDFQAGVADWSSGSAMFGVCLRRVTDGATTNGLTWTPDPDQDCLDGASDPWRGVAERSGDAGSVVASSPGGDADATASIRFGFRTDSSYRPGRYVAQLQFDVIAPSV